MPTLPTNAKPDQRSSVAYLAPELPALSATFVYEELLALEQSGVMVQPFTVRRPTHVAQGQQALAQRTFVLYDRPVIMLALAALPALFSFGRRSLTALGWLTRDMISVGLHRPIAWKLLFQLLVSTRLARSLLEQRCAHLHVHFAHTPTQIAMYASALSGVPFTVMAHANDIFERGLLLKEKARRAVKLVTISQYNLSFLSSQGLQGDKLAVVRCGVSFAPRSLSAAAYERKPVFRIGTLCRLVEKKGVDDLLRALALLKDAPWHVELSIAGDGPLRDDLELLVDALGLRDAVNFLGPLGHSAVTEWLHTLDAFVVACKKDSNGDMDGIPVVLMEAMSQRVPVVSTRLSGIPELVVHDQTGLLAQPADPASLAVELRRLLDDPELRSRLAQAAVAHVESEFGQKVNIARLLKHFSLPAAAFSVAHTTASP